MCCYEGPGRAPEFKLWIQGLRRSGSSTALSCARCCYGMIEAGHFILSPTPSEGVHATRTYSFEGLGPKILVTTAICISTASILKSTQEAFWHKEFLAKAQKHSGRGRPVRALGGCSGHPISTVSVALGRLACWARLAGRSAARHGRRAGPKSRVSGVGLGGLKYWNNRLDTDMSEQ